MSLLRVYGVYGFDGAADGDRRTLSGFPKIAGVKHERARGAGLMRGLV